MIVLTLLRITRRWNQTGQKHAGADDITKGFLTKNPTVLWLLVLCAYMDVFWRLFRNLETRNSPVVGVTLSASPVISSMLFKLSMAALDTRELIPSYLIPFADGFAQVSVVTQAQLVFSTLLLIITYVILVRNPGLNKLGGMHSIICSDYHVSLLTPAIASGITKIQPFHDVLTILVATQSRLTNIPVIWFFNVMIITIDAMEFESIVPIILTCLTMQHVSFFALGNSNAISSVDLSNAYNGVPSFNVALVGILTFLSNWGGPILWTSGTILLMSTFMSRQLRKQAKAEREARDEDTSNKKKGTGAITVDAQTVSALTSDTYLAYAEIMSTFRVVAMVAIMGACMILRMHLFVWTVFSPKYLFAMAWSVLHHGLIDMVFAAVLHWTGVRW